MPPRNRQKIRTRAVLSMRMSANATCAKYISPTAEICARRVNVWIVFTTGPCMKWNPRFSDHPTTSSTADWQARFQDRARAGIADRCCRWEHGTNCRRRQNIRCRSRGLSANSRYLHRSPAPANSRRKKNCQCCFRCQTRTVRLRSRDNDCAWSKKIQAPFANYEYLLCAVRRAPCSARLQAPRVSSQRVCR